MRSWLFVLLLFSALPAAAKERHLLYVASPGIRNYVEFGGVGLLGFDLDAGYKCVRRIPTLPVKPGEPAENVKGIAASAKTGRLFMSTPQRLLAFDLLTDKLIWNHTYEGGCDRMALSPDGKVLYVPSFEGPHWNVIDGATGEVGRKIEPRSGAHNTIFGPAGRWVYLAGLKSPQLSIADASKHEVVRTVGPFSAPVRPFTVNGRETLI